MREVPQSPANPIARIRGQRVQTPRSVPTLPRRGSELRSLGAPASPRLRNLASLWHLTSLDAPTVAVVWTFAFAWTSQVALPLWVPMFLGLACWTVYIVDRLLDAYTSLRAGQRDRLRLRHRFHWRHRRMFLPVAVTAGCAAAILVFACMPLAARERNSFLAAAALVYFTRVHSNGDRTPIPSPLRTPFLSPWISKEMLVGLLFTAACALPAFSRAGQPFPTQGPLLIAVVFFAVLAWLNCHAIERWESRSQLAGKFAIFRAALALSVAGLVAAAFLAAGHPRSAALLTSGSVSALLLGLLDRRRGSFTPLALRAAADLVLLTPVLLFFR